MQWIVLQLSRYLNEPVSRNRWVAVKRVLRYLRGTINYQLTFRSGDAKLVGYSDSDWAGASDRKSTSGYCFTLGGTDGANLISWRSQRQSVVALSTCEAEYISLSCAFQEGIYLQNLISDLSGSKLKAVQMYCDNQSAIAWSKNPVNHGRSKHISVKYHFVREHIDRGFSIAYVPSEKMLAGFLTKSVGKIVLKNATGKIFIS